MTRLRPLLVCAVCLIGLSDFGASRTSGQEKAVAKVAVPLAKAADARPVRPPRVVVNDQMIQQFEQAYGAQFRLMHRAELQFLRIVAEPTKEQFEKIAGSGDAAVKAAVRAAAEASYSHGSGGERPDPRTALLEPIIKAVQATLTPEQAARYQKELDLRAAALKQAVVRNLIASMDRVLFLRLEQREKLSKILSANWNESWNQTQILMYSGQYWPHMPDDKIMPVLSVSQQAVWRGLQKGNVNFGFQMPFVQGIQIDDEVWEKEPVKK